MPLFPLLLHAIGQGAVRLEYGRITDRCGYVDLASRTIVLNPDADDDELEAELMSDLVVLLEDHDAGVPVPAQRPALEVVRGGGEAGADTTSTRRAVE